MISKYFHVTALNSCEKLDYCTPVGRVVVIIIYLFVPDDSLTIRHFSHLNVNAAGACGYDFLCDGGRLVRAYVRLRRGAI